MDDIYTHIHMYKQDATNNKCFQISIGYLRVENQTQNVSGPKTETSWTRKNQNPQIPDPKPPHCHLLEQPPPQAPHTRDFTNHLPSLNRTNDRRNRFSLVRLFLTTNNPTTVDRKRSVWGVNLEADACNLKIQLYCAIANHMKTPFHTTFYTTPPCLVAPIWRRQGSCSAL